MSWESAMENLNRRRANNDIRKQGIIDDYAAHMQTAINRNWISEQDNLLDVGCGCCSIETYLRTYGWKGSYTGIDPFPLSSKVTKMMIETNSFFNKSFDVTTAFAVLDGVKDLDAALFEINRITKKSIILLTGIGIVPDACHTFQIELNHLDEAFKDFIRKDTIYLHPKVALIWYSSL